MIFFLDEILMSFRIFFTRGFALEWFIMTVIGGMVRSDQLGITSVVRDLAINPKRYTTYLHFFRSAAWNIERLTRH